MPCKSSILKATFYSYRDLSVLLFYEKTIHILQLKNALDQRSPNCYIPNRKTTLSKILPLYAHLFIYKLYACSIIFN